MKGSRHFVYLLIYNEMSRFESKKHSPAQVFAQFTSSAENERANEGITESKHEGAFENRREIQITETGEVSLPPDKAKVSIVCSNTKVSDRFFLAFFFTKNGSYSVMALEKCRGWHSDLNPLDTLRVLINKLTVTSFKF